MFLRAQVEGAPPLRPWQRPHHFGHAAQYLGAAMLPIGLGLDRGDSALGIVEDQQVSVGQSLEGGSRFRLAGGPAGNEQHQDEGGGSRSGKQDTDGFHGGDLSYCGSSGSSTFHS